MMKIVTAAQMQTLDRRAISEARIPGLVLMERAGTGVVEQLERHFSPLKGKRITIICGKGNNAGDGFVVARLLARKRVIVQVVTLAKPAHTARSNDSRSSTLNSGCRAEFLPMATITRGNSCAARSTRSR